MIIYIFCKETIIFQSQTSFSLFYFFGGKTYKVGYFTIFQFIFIISSSYFFYFLGKYTSKCSKTCNLPNFQTLLFFILSQNFSKHNQLYSQILHMLLQTDCSSTLFFVIFVFSNVALSDLVRSSNQCGLNYLQNLQKLYLQGDKITKIENLQYLYNLNELILKDNTISKMQNLQHLSKLEFFDLSHNDIQKPENIEDLQCLNKLNLQNNKIEMLQYKEFIAIMEEAKNKGDSPSPLPINQDIKNKIKSFLGALLGEFDNITESMSEYEQAKPVNDITPALPPTIANKEEFNAIEGVQKIAMTKSQQINSFLQKNQLIQKEKEIRELRHKLVRNFTKKLNTRIL